MFSLLVFFNSSTVFKHIINMHKGEKQLCVQMCLKFHLFHSSEMYQFHGHTLCMYHVGLHVPCSSLPMSNISKLCLKNKLFLQLKATLITAGFEECQQQRIEKSKCIRFYKALSFCASFRIKSSC